MADFGAEEYFGIFSGAAQGAKHPASEKIPKNSEVPKIIQKIIILAKALKYFLEILVIYRPVGNDYITMPDVSKIVFLNCVTVHD